MSLSHYAMMLTGTAIAVRLLGSVLTEIWSCYAGMLAQLEGLTR